MDGHVLASIFNTNETEVEIEEPFVQLEGIYLTRGAVQPRTNYADRESFYNNYVWNTSTRKSIKLLVDTHLTYVYIFYLP
jgi:hypothetical protein